MKITEVTKKLIEAIDQEEFFQRASEVLTTRDMETLRQQVADAGSVEQWTYRAARDRSAFWQNPTNRRIRDRVFGIASGLSNRGEELSTDPIIDVATIPPAPRATRRGAAAAAPDVSQIELTPLQAPSASSDPEAPTATTDTAPTAQTTAPAQPSAPNTDSAPSRPSTDGPAVDIDADIPPAQPQAPEPAAEPAPAAPTGDSATDVAADDRARALDQITTNLRRGSRGEGVRQLQTALGITADGIFGPQTEQAVRAFQQQNNLQVDGVVGRQTLSAIQRGGTTDVAPGRIGNAPASTPAPQARPVDPQAAQAVSRISANQRRQIGTDAGDGLVWIVGNGNFLTRTRPNDPRVAAQRAAVAAAGNESIDRKENALVEGIVKLAGLSNKKQLNEASVTINGAAEEIAELMRMMQLAGANGAKPVDATMINQPEHDAEDCGCSSCASKKMGPPEPSMGDMIRMISSEEVATEETDDGDFGNATTEPDETISDFSASIPSGNDLHKEKGSYPATAGGDNPMKIKEQLLKALAEKKSKKVDEYAKKKKKKTYEADFKAPNYEISDTARQATRIAQMIKQKINSGDQMDDRDYNQMAELGAVLSRLGTSFGPKTMKDVLNHMIEYTDERNEEGHNYPEFNVDRFKELIAMAKE